MSLMTAFTCLVVLLVFAITFTTISVSYPSVNRTRNKLGMTSLRRAGGGGLSSSSGAATTTTTENWKEIDPDLDTQQMVINSMWKYVVPAELMKVSESRERVGKAFKWGCVFLYRPCSWLNALNPFKETDCCIGNCYLSWSSSNFFSFQWKCFPQFDLFNYAHFDE